MGEVNADFYRSKGEFRGSSHNKDSEDLEWKGENRGLQLYYTGNNDYKTSGSKETSSTKKKRSGIKYQVLID